MRGQATRGNHIQFGDFGIMALDCGWITSRQIEAARIAMTRSIKRGGQVWIRIFPDKPITKKPLEQRMGKGKAPVEGWVAVVKPGRIMFEMNGVAVETAKEAMRLAMMKLPIRCRFVTKGDFGIEAIASGAGKDHSETQSEGSNGVVAKSKGEERVDVAEEASPESTATQVDSEESEDLEAN